MGVKHKNIEATGGELTAAEWNEEHDIDWLSPAEEYIPLLFRTDAQGLIYYEDPYIVIRLHAVANLATSWLGFGKAYSYGTYEWRAKAKNAVANSVIYLGLFERHHGWLTEGAISVLWDGGAWVFETRTDVAPAESTAITGVDFTGEHKFKVEWTSTSVKLYVDDVLKATHTTKVPYFSMQLFCEVATAGSAPASEPYSYFRVGSFKKIA